jgi:hypothetical protein
VEQSLQQWTRHGAKEESKYSRTGFDIRFPEPESMGLIIELQV